MRFIRGESEGYKYSIALTHSWIEHVSFKFKSKGWKTHATHHPEKYSFIKWKEATQ